MAKRKNTTEVLDDITTYASRYGLEALGYALLDMVKNNELHLTSTDTTNLWEYGGNIQEL